MIDGRVGKCWKAAREVGGFISEKEGRGYGSG
jgi:hypothetical protein